MGLRRDSLRGTLLLSLGEGVNYGSSFIRNMVLARILTRADFGIAAAFAMIITLLEFSGKLGVARFLIRDKEAGEPGYLDTAHAVQGGAGILSAVLLLIGAWPLASLFELEHHFVALSLLAIVPLLNGFGHLGVRRMERDLRFGPSMAVDLIPQVIITLLVWPAGRWFGDYRAVLALLLLKAAISCIGSHLLAEEPYRWRVNQIYFKRFLRFGWPLVVTGFLTFGVLQGDQFIVGTFYSMPDLAAYAAAAALTMAPTFIFGRVFNSVLLPLMAKAQDDPEAFGRRYRLAISIICAFTVGYATGVIIGAEAIMRLAYGDKYAGSGVILGWLSAANSFRNIRIAPTLAAMAKGDTVNQMISNWWRISALLPAFALAWYGKPIVYIAATGLAGEALSCGATFVHLKRRDGFPLSWSLRHVAIVLGAAVMAGLGSQYLEGNQNLFWGLLIAAVTAVLSSATLVLVLPELQRERVIFWNEVKQRLPKWNAVGATSERRE